MKKTRWFAGVACLLGMAALVSAGTYHVKFDFETGWGGDYAPGWENTSYRHGDPPVGKMMQQVSTSHGGSSGMKLIADSVPQSWMWWAYVNPVSVNAEAMKKEYDPWISVWYYDEGYTDGNDPAGQMFAVPSWTNLYLVGGTEDWTDVQFGARDNVEDNYYYVACGEGNPGWVDTGEARPTTPEWHHLKMQLSSADGTIHFYIDGSEVATSWRGDYADLGTEFGLGTRFKAPLSDWDPKPYTIWDDYEFGSSYIPEPLTAVGVFGAVGALGAYIRKRRAA